MTESVDKEPARSTATAATTTGTAVVFYQLSAKFVDDAHSIPDEAADVMYYTLAVGHHTGIIDCFTEKLCCPAAVFAAALALIPTDDPAHYKLDGINRKGEIQVDQSHLAALLPAITAALAQSEAMPVETGVQEWLTAFAQILTEMQHNPAIYLMGRKILP